MRSIALDEKWRFRKGFLDSIGMLEADPGVEVNLPHDGMIGTAVSPDAPAEVENATLENRLAGQDVSLSAHPWCALRRILAKLRIQNLLCKFEQIRYAADRRQVCDLDGSV